MRYSRGMRVAFYPEREGRRQYLARDGAEGIVQGYSDSGNLIEIEWDDPRSHGQSNGVYASGDFREVDNMAVKSAALLAAEEALEKEKAAHLADLNKVFSALRYEAEAREWCDEYDDFAGGLARELTAQPTEGIAKDWELDVIGLTVKVHAFTEGEAINKLHDYLSNSMFSGVLETD